MARSFVLPRNVDGQKGGRALPDWDEVFGALAKATGNANWPMVASTAWGSEQEGYDTTAVKRAAEALVAIYGDKAVDRALRLEKTSGMKMVARVVRVEVERLCRSTQ